MIEGDKVLRALGFNQTEQKLLSYMLKVPDGVYVTSTKITKDIGLIQSNISEAAKDMKDLGWIESSTKGYRRVKSVEEIKAELLRMYEERVEKV